MGRRRRRRRRVGNLTTACTVNGRERWEGGECGSWSHE